MKSNPTTNKTTISKPTKATKNRITALILALLFAVTVLIPQIPVKAQETTTQSAGISENNSSGGTSAGAGDNFPIDTTNNASFESVLHYKFKDGLSMKDYNRTYNVRLKGEGHFNVRSVDIYNSTSEGHLYKAYVFSDKPFTTSGPLTDVLNGETKVYENWNNSDAGTVMRNFGNGSYYYDEIGIGSINKNDEFISFNSPNKISFTSSEGVYDTNLQKYIESTLDLSKDDYISDEDKADMTPVRDESIGYLPRARYFDNRKSVSSSHNITATIQWDSFQEPYVSDLENPFYVEIYAKCYYEKLGETTTYRMYKYKKYGDVKYISERCSFPDDEPCINFLSSSNIELSDLVYGISFPHLYNYGISEYYVRLVHFDDKKQQLLCGGFTKLTLDGKGGCTSSEGDFDNDGDWNDDPDGSGDKGWDDGGDIKPIVPDPGNPDFTIDDSNVFTLLYSLVKSASNFISGTITLFLNAFKTILSSVGEFPALFKHLFSFLPNEITYLMLAGVAAVVVMRFLGR